MNLRWPIIVILLMFDTGAYASEKPPESVLKLLKAKYFSGETVQGYTVNLTFKVPHCLSRGVNRQGVRVRCFFNKRRYW